MSENSWVKSIDAIFVINLLKRNDRRQQIEQELAKYDIPFLLWPAVENENGAEGLRQTMDAIFRHVLCMTFHKRILILEDDAIVLEDINQYMPRCLSQLPNDFDLLYLGCQHNQPFEKFHSENLLEVTSAFATHAVLWSERGMKKFLAHCNGLPIDREIRNKIQCDNKCYAAYPMLVSQRPSHSDIEGRVVDWKRWLEDLFYKNVKHLVN